MTDEFEKNVPDVKEENQTEATLNIQDETVQDNLTLDETVQDNPMPDEAAQAETEMEEPKKTKTGLIVAIVAIVAILGACAGVFLPKYLHVSKADKARQEKNYELAIEEYSLAKGFLSSEEKQQETYLEYAAACSEQGSYDDMLAILEKVDEKHDARSIYVDSAKDCISKKQYVNATKILSALPSMTGVEDLWKACGLGFVAGGDYDKAITVLKRLSDSESANYLSYSQAKLDIKDKKYESAVRNLNTAGGILDSKDLIISTYYDWGKSIISSNPTLAKQYFIKAGDYQDAGEMVTACDFQMAENLLNVGNYNEALATYKTLPSDFSYRGITVGSRISLLNNASSLINAVGTWKATSNYIESRNIWRYNGSWDNWYIDETDPSQKVVISISMNSNGTFDLKGTVSFYRFTNYSSLSRYCNATMTSRNFKANNITSMPSSFDIGSNATLTYSSGAFNLKYSVRDDYSSNFYNLYNSTVKYGNHAS